MGRCYSTDLARVGKRPSFCAKVLCAPSTEDNETLFLYLGDGHRDAKCVILNQKETMCDPLQTVFIGPLHYMCLNLYTAFYTDSHCPENNRMHVLHDHLIPGLWT